MAGETQVVETLGVLKGAGLAQCRHQPAVLVLGGHAGPQVPQQQSLCVGGAHGEASLLQGLSPRTAAGHPPWGDLLRAFFSKGQSPLTWVERPSLLPNRSPGGR